MYIHACGLRAEMEESKMETNTNIAEISAQEKAAQGRRQKKTTNMRGKALALALEAGLHHDEHGGYTRGDHHTLSVTDSIYRKADMRATHASGKLLALVTDTRKRVYSKKYTRRFGPGMREDAFLVGKNENGVSFMHGVSKSCTTVADAVAWIWSGHEIVSRHGDVALTPAKLKLPGCQVTGAIISGAHVFSGEMHKNGATYVRNGTLHHEKNQHPDVIVGAEWMRVLIAKRATAGGSHD